MFSKQTQTTTGLKKVNTELYVQYSKKQICPKPNKLPINKDLWTVTITPPGITPHQNLNFCCRGHSIWSIKASEILWVLTLTPQSKALKQRWHFAVWLSATSKSINHTHHTKGFYRARQTQGECVLTKSKCSCYNLVSFFLVWFLIRYTSNCCFFFADFEYFRGCRHVV